MDRVRTDRESPAGIMPDAGNSDVKGMAVTDEIVCTYARHPFLEDERSPFFNELRKRVGICINALVVHRDDPSNCAGSALYITGEQEKDRSVHTRREKSKHPGKDVFDYLDDMGRIRTPMLGAVVAWKSMREEEMVHMGVITSMSPTGKLFITHREKYRGKFFVNQPFEEIEYNRYFDVDIEIYLPNGLRNLEGRQDPRSVENQGRVDIKELKRKISGRSVLSAYTDEEKQKIIA